MPSRFTDSTNSAPLQSEQLENSLRRAIRGEVFAAAYDRSLYASDASLYEIPPRAVVVPRDADDVQATVAVAAEMGVPLVPRGCGTSLSGQSIGPGIVLDLSKYMNRILDIDPEARLARVQPGVVLDVLNAALAPHGLQFGPEVATSSRANLGGMIGNNSAGARSVLHGKVVDHVVELEAVLSDARRARFAPLTPGELTERQRLPGIEGEVHRQIPRIVAEHRQEIFERFPPLVRRVSGYNLDEFVPECGSRLDYPPWARDTRAAQAARFPGADFNLARLLVGSEGTLATVTEAVLHLIPLPKARGIVVLEFDSLASAIDSVNPTLTVRPSAIELFDKMILELAAESLEYRHYLDFVVGKPESLVLVEFCGDSPEAVDAQIARLREVLAAHSGLAHFSATRDAKLAAHIWACRKAALPLLMGVPGTRKPVAIVEDSAVAPTRLPEFVARFREILARAGTNGAFYGHASVGVLHLRPMIDTRDPADLDRMQQILNEVADLVYEFGGAMSGEHGDGLARSWLIEKFFGPRLYDAFRQVKRAFDPRGLMNPGKIIDAPRPTENLRHPPGVVPLPVVTALDFSRQGGLMTAIDLCNGSALCRKTQTGTMCPSYMVTRDEEHSTRGRANALRQVLSGNLPADEWAGERLYQTFDLCLQCKGCKAECPSNVDVAKLKIEFLHHYHLRNGTPLSARIMGRIDRWNRLGAAMAPFSNWLPRLPGAGWVAQQVLGIDSRRPLPHFERDHFRRWFARHVAATRGARGPIVLVDDCLTRYCQSRVNRAAVEVLEAAGYEVHLADIACCGRAALSKGLVDEGKNLARENLSRLLPWVGRGVPIVGTEPSCLLTMADDYLDLGLGNDAERLAAHVALLDSFLLEHIDELRLPARSSAPAGEILLHGHCHQKALVGVAHTKELLERATGQNVCVVDSGCCGMAGSFGYEHYELSMQIGERVLLPAARRAAGPVAAPGFSCRHQIAHGAGREAQHPVEMVADALRANRQ